ncbi:MAG: quinol:cytochrome C oxidoreductase [Bacteroidia bacterium]|nr:quinol:cytochrome C oxidoreductase [Bacteroidia bacterium]
MKAVHYTKEQLTERFEFTPKLRNFIFGLIGVGLVLVLLGAFLGGGGEEHATEGGHHAAAAAGEVIAVADTDGGHHADHPPVLVRRILANLLISSLYFMTIAMGCMFFLTVHRIGNAGWHTAIKRVPEAIVTWLPVGAAGFAILCIFLNQLYEWAILPAGADAIIDSKRAYLNQPFFIARTFVFFLIWGAAAWYYRRLSHKQDAAASSDEGVAWFKRSEALSAGFVVFFALSYSFFAVDWIKSLEPHWFSTIFGVQVFAGSMVIANVTMYLLLLYLQNQGYMKYVNPSHYHDLGKYTFGFSIFWAYTWLAQYLLIWYANIPEEGIYYVKRYRVEDPEYLGYAFFFYANIIINFITPFFALMTRDAKRHATTFVPVGILLIYGHWQDLFQMVMPGAVGKNQGIGFLEIGFFLAFAGLFMLVVFRSLTRANLAPVNHPYLEESLHHTTGAV